MKLYKRICKNGNSLAVRITKLDMHDLKLGELNEGDFVEITIKKVR